jgi:hypothetical protein
MYDFVPLFPTAQQYCLFNAQRGAGSLPSPVKLQRRYDIYCVGAEPCQTNNNNQTLEKMRTNVRS